MQHAITVADVLKVSGIAILAITVIGGILWFLSALASGWNH